MNQEELRKVAEDFERVAKQMSVNVPIAEIMLRGMHSIITRVKAGEVDAPMEWRDIPFGYLSVNGDLRPYPELESTYAKFKLEFCNISIPDKLV